jgi:hypothetical protein
MVASDRVAAWAIGRFGVMVRRLPGFLHYTSRRSHTERKKKPGRFDRNDNLSGGLGRNHGWVAKYLFSLAMNVSGGCGRNDISVVDRSCVYPAA